MTLPVRVVVLCLGACAVMAAVAADSRISDAASATEAAKRYLKARCTLQVPCKFKPEREGNQWRVWVELPKRASKRDGPAPQIVLFFDTSGNLIRRLEVE